MIKVIIFGCQKITLDIIDYLLKQKNVKILIIFTYEIPADYSRSNLSIINEAKLRGIETYDMKFFSKELYDQIKYLSPDFIISSYYRKILPKEIYSMAQHAINIHPSYLPYYRGPVPTAWAILNGEKSFGVSIHKIDKGIDTGDIYAQKLYKIKPYETGFELYNRAMSKGFELFKKNFFKIAYQKLKPKKQKKGGSYFGALNEDVFVNWKDTKENIINKVRVNARPYNPLQTCLLSKYLIINKVLPYKGNILVQKPGKILKVLKNDKLLVSVADGALIVEEYEFFPSLKKGERKHYIKVGNSFSKLLY